MKPRGSVCFIHHLLFWVFFCTFGVLAAEPLLKMELEPGNELELIYVPAGTFFMGSTDGEQGRGEDEKLHQVRLSRPFYLGKTEVTVGQFDAFVRATRYRTQAEDGKSGGYGWNGTALEQSPRYHWRNPGYEQTKQHPVTLVTWADAKKFCQWLTVKSGRAVQLPTEAQWEHACRAGETGAWSGGAAEDVGWSLTNSAYRAHPVGGKRPNAWGFYDMHGNAWEWCEDWYAAYPMEDRPDPVQTSANLSDKPRRVLRGGSWLKDSRMTRSAARFRNDPQSRNPDNGFRVLVLVEEKSTMISVPGPGPGQGGASAGASGVGIESNGEKVEVKDGRIRIRPEPVGTPAVPERSVPARADSQEGVGHGPVRRATSERSGMGLWVGGIFLAVLAAVVVVILRGLARFLKGTAQGRVTPGEEVRSAGGATGRGPLFQVRPVQDGFWVQASVALGTRLGWRCQVGGKWHEGELEYLAGTQGQFVYTALPPSDISVRTLGGGVSGTAGTPTSGGPIYPSEDFGRAAGMWSVLSEREDRERESRTTRPPSRPSAY